MKRYAWLIVLVGICVVLAYAGLDNPSPNADTLDGLDSSVFARSDTEDTITGVWTYDNASFKYSSSLIFSSTVTSNAFYLWGGGSQGGIFSIFGEDHPNGDAAGDVRFFAGSSAGQIEFGIGSSRSVTVDRNGRPGS